MTDMIVCSRCGQDAPRYQQRSRVCGECSRLAARLRAAARDPQKNRESVRAWKRRNPVALAQQRKLTADKALEDLGSGRIHIDHIVPKSSFDVTDPAELRACWSLANLRPVPAVVNLRKGAKRESLL